MHIPRLTFLWFVLFGPVPALAAVSAVDDAIREQMRGWLADNGGVGLSIGIYDAGQRRFYNAGVPRLDANKPPTKDTIYEIGAIAKTMTGQLLARAIVEGRAVATDDIGKYLADPYPNLENGGERIRLVHLANMTSQLADVIPDLTQVRAVPGEPLAATQMRVVVQYSPAEFLRQLRIVSPRRPPGSALSQSNVAAMLLAVALAKMYGEPFDVTLNREIERPLRMASGTQPDLRLLAKGYTAADEELPTFGARMAHPYATLRYSADDLLKYAAWQLVERDASVKLAHQPTLSTGGRSGVAFYWIVGESQRGRRLHYSGTTFGFASTCELYPDAKIALVLLANKATDGAQESLRALSGRIVALLRPATLTSSAGVPPPGR
jgi:D-alanyl-D-alanine-carboxypeptidase/D-alanyl-D-alanine-endopeptidase